MLFSKIVLALAAVTAVAALPAPAKPTSKAPATKLSAQSKPKSAAAKQKSYNNKVAAAKKNTKTKAVKGANGKTTTSVVPATTTVAPAPAAATAAVIAATTIDSGIANVINGCENADGKTGCFEILGDLKDDCFTIPRPLAGNVQFFAPPPTGVCSLFTDVNCLEGEQPKVAGVTQNKAALAWSCTDAATAAAADAKAAADAAAQVSSSVAAASTSAAAATTTAAADASTTVAANTAAAVETDNAKFKKGKLTSKGKPMTAAAKAKQYANKVAKAKAAQAAGTTTNAAAAATATAALDSGVANTIEGCENPDGKTTCFQILGDLKGDCFTIPPPLLNNVQFFLVPPTGVCSLFTDADCTQGEQAKVDGVVKNKAVAAWSCVDQATSDAADAQAAKDAAAALASSSSAAAASSTTAAAANTAVATKGKTGKLTSKGKPMTAAAKAKQYANKVAKAKAAQAAGTTTNAAAAATATATLDSGIANTIKGCENPDGKTTCFEIQGDLKGDCFTIPPPLLNNVQFFVVPPTGVCSLFSDADCTQGEQAKVDGVVKNKAAAAWSCVDQATSDAADAQAAKDAAAALASSSSAAAAATGKANTAAAKTTAKATTSAKATAKATSTKATAKATSTKATAKATSTGKANTAAVKATSTKATGKATSTKAATNTAAATKSKPTKLTAKAKKPMTKAAKAKQYANLVAKAKAAQKGGKKTVTKGKDGKTTTSTAAATTTAAPPAANTAAAVVDSGVANVIEACEDKDQKTCFQILGDLKGDCFTFPRPIANNVAFFLPPPTGVCSLFSDENCSAGEQASAVGASTSPVVNSWSCVDQATATATAAQAAKDAAAAASSSAAAASTTDAAATSTTDSAPPAANTAVATATLDTGIDNVVELCEDVDQKTCFEILGDTKQSCFTMPNPIAKNVAFFIPSPKSTCTLFTDEDCTQGAEAGSGATTTKAVNSWSCVAAAAA